MIGLITPFQILEHLDRLKVVKESSSEYHCLCPVCGDGGFKVNKKNGSYQAFKCGCEVKDIREAVNPWREVRPKRQQNKEPKKASVANDEIKLARLPEIPKDIAQKEQKPIPEWLQSQGVAAEATQTRYWYSKTQWVSRFEWTTPEGKAKTIRQGHIKSNGLREWKKGSKDWRAYRLSEAVKHCQGKWVLGLEGEGCVETARAKEIAAITWQGSNWKSKAIAADLIKLKENGAVGLVYFPDHDEAGKKKAELVLSACKSVDFPCLILSPTDVWAQMPAKGDITDFVEAHPKISTKELNSKLESAFALAAERDEQEKIELKEIEQLANLPSWSQSDIADWLASRYKSRLAWNVEEQEWYRYGSIRSGIWNSESAELIGQLVKSEVKAIALSIFQFKGKKPSYTISFINGVTALLKLELAVRRWNEASGLLPMLNGVLDLKTRKLLPHSPENRLTWCLPYNYNLLATCEPIQEWLLSTYNGDRALVELMRAYLLGIVTGRTDWQKYLELVGPGGTGKSTFTRLATALVGTENVHTTTLHKLEKSKFEPASIVGKRLVLINDSERYAGEVGKLKNLTGQDTLPYEVKFKQSKGGFNPDALVIVSTNEVIQSSDYTSGLARRRISIPMFKQIKGDRQKNLIEHKNGQMSGEFLPYIPGLLNWVLAMDEESATSIIKNYEVAVPSLLAMKARTLVETNPIADWLDNFIIYEKEARTNVGVAKRDKDNNSPCWYLDTDRWLYPNYAEYCHNSGTRPVSLRRFVTLLSDLGKNQLGLEIRKERDRFGSYFVGLKIRSEDDHEPPLITGERKCSEFKDIFHAQPKGNTSVVINTKSSFNSTNVIDRLWTMVMDKVTQILKDTAPHMMDYVMDESIDSDGYDDCDGKNKKSSNNQSKVEYENKCNTIIESADKKPERLKEFSKMPSYPSPKKTQRQTERDVMDSNSESSAITVGDHVMIDDCPGHWAWASPFTVEGIEGEMVKLEMVGELVEIERLERV
jgi:putative DNA primase/helicase